MFDLATIKILFLFLPGIFSTTILELFNEKNKKYSVNERIFYSFILSILSYFLYLILVKIFYQSNNKNLLIELINFNGTSFPLSIREIFFLSLIGVALGIIFTILRTQGLIHKYTCKYRISYETGFNSVFKTIYKSNEKEMKNLREKYVQIKLLDGTADYYGFIKLYEIHDNYIEVLLFGSETLANGDVEINFKNNLRNPKEYTQKAIYLILLNGTFIIEYL